MTEEEKEAERIKSLASATYRALDEAVRAEDYVRLVTKRHGEHPAFKQYMSEMLLAGRLKEFMARKEMGRA